MSYNVVVGDVNEDLAKYAKTIDSQAYMINDKNVHNTHKGTVYVSIGDISSLKSFYNLLKDSSTIICSYPFLWSDQKSIKDKFSMHWLTSNYIKLISKNFNIPVINFEDVKLRNLQSYPRQPTVGRQLWVVGCSTTSGCALHYKDQTYGNLISKELKLPLNLVAVPGSSNEWAGNQILQLDLHKEDLLIWGLTSIHRFTYILNDSMHHVTSSYYQQNKDFNNTISMNYLDSEDILYRSIQSVLNVKNYCKNIGIKLLLVGIHANLELSAAIADSNFLSIHGTNGLDWHSNFLDFGYDNQHPGPLTHDFYAKCILNKLKELEYI